MQRWILRLDWMGKGLAAKPDPRIRGRAAGLRGAHFSGTKAALELENFRSWSPDDPFLYTVRIEAGEDAVESYFGMREFGIVRGGDGHPRLALNGKPIFHTGLLDQGYWSDGLYTAPSDEAMVWELTEDQTHGIQHAAQAHQDRAAALVLSLRQAWNYSSGRTS